MPEPEPTVYVDLNHVLAELVSGLRAILGDQLVGAYLQGSFALGSADEHSDVDFIVALSCEPTDEQASALQELHERLYRLPSPWAQHLEGSYAPAETLWKVDPARAPLLYLDNGATELVRDRHCNTAVVRWTLREHGVVLAGPPPRALIDPVSADELANDVRFALREWIDWLQTNDPDRRTQGALVLTLCRMLVTLGEARVTSKNEAGAWALERLEPEWRPLIRHALEDRPDPWRKVHEPADPVLLEQTRAFVGYVSERSR